mmetsp:Transcript_47465/g.84909  ORF Transcript_47465/g.84909 Transcript_47465/m.84909 type:complete len:87 (+) Transcript_47465:184-444(+)
MRREVQSGNFGRGYCQSLSVSRPPPTQNSFLFVFLVRQTIVNVFRTWFSHVESRFCWSSSVISGSNIASLPPSLVQESVCPRTVHR